MNTLIKKTLAVTTAMMLCLPNFSISATEQADNIRNMKEYVLGMETADSYADVNKDGVIDTADIIKLKNILSK